MYELDKKLGMLFLLVRFLPVTIVLNNGWLVGL
jgi:hypothetical protein